MVPFKQIIILSLIQTFLLFSFVQVSAQNCDGDLGEQLFFEDFGSGSGPGPSLPAGTTTYTYGSIGGGHYVVTNTTGLNGNLWHNAPDHTPNDTDGYCLLFDASSTQGVFYKKLFEDLCPNTKYIFSCYAANIVSPSACGGNSIEPNLQFNLIDPSTMAILGSVNTGDIPTTDGMTWNIYSISFSTNLSQQDILIEITNNANGGCGNDLAIDDFSFSICNPATQQTFELCALPGNMIQVGTETYSSPGMYQTVIDIPNSCNDSIVYTSLTGNAPSNINQYFTFCEGDSVTVNGQTYTSDIIIIDTIGVIENCHETITYIIVEEEISTTATDIYFCERDSISIAGVWVYEEGIYQDIFTSIHGCDSIVNFEVHHLEYIMDLNVSMFTLDPGETIQLIATSNATETAEYQWMPPELFSCSDCEAPIFSPNASGTYSVIAYDLISGCTDSLQFNVEITPCDESYFPNAFSPNFDGINDYYHPFLSNCIIEILTFQVYDRWGNMVHKQNNIPSNAAKWDGQFRSQNVPIGVYTFFINAQIFDGSTKIYKGDITLLR